MKDDKQKAIVAGCDDYISKPFSMEELLLKIKIFLRRSQSQPVNDNNTPKNIPIGKFIFHPDDLSLSFDGSTRNLTLKEAELIRFFAERPNKVLSRNDILAKVWGSDDYFLGRSLDVFISRLYEYISYDDI